MPRSGADTPPLPLFLDPCFWGSSAGQRPRGRACARPRLWCGPAHGQGWRHHPEHLAAGGPGGVGSFVPGQAGTSWTACAPDRRDTQVSGDAHCCSRPCHRRRGIRDTPPPRTLGWAPLRARSRLTESRELRCTPADLALRWGRQAGRVRGGAVTEAPRTQVS